MKRNMKKVARRVASGYPTIKVTFRSWVPKEVRTNPDAIAWLKLAEDSLNKQFKLEDKS